MQNVNTKTGIPFGVVNANLVSELFDDIVSRGESLNLREYRQEIADSIKAAILSVVQERIGDGQAARQIVDQLDADTLAQLVESTLDPMGEDLQTDEEEFEHTESTEAGPVTYQLGYLGGAPLIWVCDSPYLAHAPGCSPCVPGAGDLDNIREDGALCYCCPPDAFDTEDETADRYEIIGETTIGDRTYKIVGRVAEPAAGE